MQPIFIDTRDLAAEFALSKEQVNSMISYTIKGLTASFARTWDAEAKNSLGSTRQQYRSSIVVGEEGPFTGYVMLVNTLPNMIESGASAFDMKVGFSKSSKKKFNASGGWYLTVPMRHATPGSLGESSAFSGTMPSAVYGAAKTATATKTTSSGGSVRGRGLTQSQIPSQYAIPKSRAMIEEKNQVFEEYKHKHSIYEGMQKSSKKYENATQSQYVTFRRVSSNSDPNSWIHKGFQAKLLAEKAMNVMDVPSEVGMFVDKYLARLGF